MAGKILRSVAAAVLLFVLLASLTDQAVIARKKKKSDKEHGEVWLENQDIYNTMQGDDPGLTYLNDLAKERDKCPAPPMYMPSKGCKVKQCKADSACASDRYKCCYNGCVFTCMETNRPPPVIDWLREPPPRLQSGSSWLVPGPDRDLEVESCSTTKPTDAAALLCPHGYLCIIDDPGDPANDIPNSGKCVPEKDTRRPNQLRKKHFELKTDIKHDNVCIFKKIIYHSGSKFTYHKHACTCKRGSILCNVNDHPPKR